MSGGLATVAVEGSYSLAGGYLSQPRDLVTMPYSLYGTVSKLLLGGRGCGPAPCKGLCHQQREDERGFPVHLHGLRVKFDLAPRDSL